MSAGKPLRPRIHWARALQFGSSGNAAFLGLLSLTNASDETLLVRPRVAGLAQWISPRCVKHSQLLQTCTSACGAKRLAQALSNEKQDRKPSA